MPGYLQYVYVKPRITSTYWSLLSLKRGSLLYIFIVMMGCEREGLKGIHNYYSKFITRALLHNMKLYASSEEAA